MEDYKILEASNFKDLEREVLKYLSQGYSLAGGHQVTIVKNMIQTNLQNAIRNIQPEMWSITQAVYKVETYKERTKI